MYYSAYLEVNLKSQSDSQRIAWLKHKISPLRTLLLKSKKRFFVSAVIEPLGASVGKIPCEILREKRSVSFFGLQANENEAGHFHKSVGQA